MLLILSALCQMGVGEQLPDIISALFYYASPQNRWAGRLFPHVPQRLVVDDGDGNRLFYEGTAGATIPYASWAEPLIWWAAFLLARYVTMVSIAVIRQRQWIDGKRLSYPAAQVDLEMIRGEESGRLVNRFFRSPAMWIGWTVPMVLSTLHGLKQYGIAIPTPTTSWNLPFVGSQGLHLSVDFTAIGFSYLIHTHLAFGICFFNLLAKCEKAFMHAAGIKSSQTIIYGVDGFPLLGFDGADALLAMVLVGLWIARGHLANAWRKAIGRAPQIDDGDEIMSYRGAICGAVSGVLVMAVWLWIMGTPAWISLLFVVVAMLVFIGLTRIVVEAGLVKLRAPMCAPDLVIQGLGSSLVGSAGVVNLSLAYIWAADVRVFVMGTCANALKLLEGMDRRSRHLIFWGIVLALLIGGVGSLWMVFHLTYKYGGVNMGSWFFNRGPETAYANAVRNLDPSGIYWEGLGFFGGGGAVMTLMMVERGFGRIVNLIHIYALERGAPPFAHSGAARAGVANLTRTLAAYYARHGVTVNALAPGLHRHQRPAPCRVRPAVQ